jgi:DNA polymerase elongation subunit (family B)
MLKNLAINLRKSERVKELFNLDLIYIQQYLFSKLKIEPTSMIRFRHDGERLILMEKLDDGKDITPPPFTVLYFDFQPKTLSLTPDANRDPIGFIKSRFHDEENIFRSDEADVIEKFAKYVDNKDPDFLISPKSNYIFSYLLMRCRILGINPQLGREEININSINEPLPYWIRGRVALDFNSFGNTFEDWGIAGLAERARFSFLTPDLAGRWTSNKIIDSRNCYELIKRGYVIPKNTGYYEYIRSMREIVESDRGGIIIPPKIDAIHENVAELDYISQYPNIIVKECISYETIGPKGIIRRKDALLPYVTESYLKRRIYFKRLRKNYPKHSKEWQWCEQRQNALKLILVCLYGTSGCCWNRFGNVLAFEEINRKSREIMIKTKNYAQKRGFEIIYADTDSIFVKKANATKEVYEHLAKELSNFIGLPISLDHHYKFLLLLSLRSDPSGTMEAQKHYFGLLQDGVILARGIEIRRHDTPRLIKDLQARLIRTLFDCKDAEEVRRSGYKQSLLVLTETINKVMVGEVEPRDLVVSKILRKVHSKYSSIFPHVSAAIQLASRGRNVKQGEKVDFIFTDVDHQNPLCRVIPYDLIKGRIVEDRKKYKGMILDAAETILSTFGFKSEDYDSERSKGYLW